jgi:hypothetical protein
MSAFNEMKIKNKDELTKEESREKETQEVQEEKLQQSICAHIKKILENYFKEGILKELRLNISLLNEDNISKLKQMLSDAGHDVIQENHVLIVNKEFQE